MLTDVVSSFRWLRQLAEWTSSRLTAHVGEQCAPPADRRDGPAVAQPAAGPPLTYLSDWVGRVIRGQLTAGLTTGGAY